MKIKNIDLPTTKAITPKLLAALDAVSKELGIKIELVCKSYGKMDAKYNLIVNVDDGMTLAKRDFMHYAPQHEVTEKLGDIVLFQGKQFRIVGWKPSARRFPIVAVKMSDGQTYGLALWMLPSKIAAQAAMEKMFAANREKALAAAGQSSSTPQAAIGK